MFVSYDTEGGHTLRCPDHSCKARVLSPGRRLLTVDKKGGVGFGRSRLTRAPETENGEILVDSSSNIEAYGILSYNKL